jgi:hypothetical protein
MLLDLVLVLSSILIRRNRYGGFHFVLAT